METTSTLPPEWIKIPERASSSGGAAGSQAQKYVIVETGTYEKISTLTIVKVQAEDSGHYTCKTSNHAGKVESNFTLQVLITAEQQ